MSNCLYLHEQTHRLHNTTLKIHKPSRSFLYFPWSPELVFIDMK